MDLGTVEAGDGGLDRGEVDRRSEQEEGSIGHHLAQPAGLVEDLPAAVRVHHEFVRWVEKGKGDRLRGPLEWQGAEGIALQGHGPITALESGDVPLQGRVDVAVPLEEDHAGRAAGDCFEAHRADAGEEVEVDVDDAEDEDEATPSTNGNGHRDEQVLNETIPLGIDDAKDEEE